MSPSQLFIVHSQLKSPRPFQEGAVRRSLRSSSTRCPPTTICLDGHHRGGSSGSGHEVIIAHRKFANINLKSSCAYYKGISLLCQAVICRTAGFGQAPLCRARTLSALDPRCIIDTDRLSHQPLYHHCVVGCFSRSPQARPEPVRLSRISLDRYVSKHVRSLL